MYLKVDLGISQKLGWKIVDCYENGEMRSVDQIHEKIIEIVIKEG